jgi:hypothetical protein
MASELPDGASDVKQRMRRSGLRSPTVDVLVERIAARARTYCADLA